MNLRLLLCCVLPPLLATPASAADSSLKLAKLDPDNRTAGRAQTWQRLNPKQLDLRSTAALVVDSHGNEVYAKEGDKPLPIASITKLMTAMVILDSTLSLDEPVQVTKADRDLIQLTGSRLEYGATLPRGQMLQLALMASENRAANALGRTWPGGRQAFVKAMNGKARELGMRTAHFADPAGLNPGNVASARDLARMVRAAAAYPFIRKATTTTTLSVHPYKRRGPLRYVNTNRLLKNKAWTIRVSKTGYLNEAGRCLTMEAEIVDEPMVIVLLNSFGKLTPFGDSNRIRQWIENGI